MKKEKVAVIGLGYVGFPLLCAVAKTDKYEVYGFDIDESKVKLAQKHISPVEDWLAESLVKEVKYTVSTNVDILEDIDIYIVCVPLLLMNFITLTIPL